MKRLILAALLIAAPLFAQQKEEHVTKLVALKYADPENLRGLIGIFGVNVSYAPGIKALSINGLTSNVAAAESAIAKLDVAPKNLELVVYFVVGSDQANLTGTAVPGDVRDVM